MNNECTNVHSLETLWAYIKVIVVLANTVRYNIRCLDIKVFRYQVLY